MMGMTLKIYFYVDKMPHPNYYYPMGMGGWQETEE
jgi:hypothetical protein